MTDGSQKVKDTHEVQCWGINPEGHPSVSLVDPRERDATKGSFWTRQATKRDPLLTATDSMKAAGAKLGDAHTPFIHLQAPRSPFDNRHCGDKTNLTFD